MPLGSLLTKSDLPINFPVKIEYTHVASCQVHSDLIIYFHGWVNSKQSNCFHKMLVLLIILASNIQLQHGWELVLRKLLLRIYILYCFSLIACKKLNVFLNHCFLSFWCPLPIKSPAFSCLYVIAKARFVRLSILLDLFPQMLYSLSCFSCKSLLSMLMATLNTA